MITNDEYRVTAEFYDYVVPYRDRDEVLSTLLSFFAMRELGETGR